MGVEASGQLRLSSTELVIGDNCYVGGYFGKITGKDRDGWLIAFYGKAATVAPKKNYPIYQNTEIVCCVPKLLVEPLVSEVIHIGDKVQAVYPGNHGFTGVVTGFESDTNKIVCMSSNDTVGTRCRYSYTLDEVNVNKNFTFTIGLKYQLKDTTLLAIEHPSDKNVCLLVNLLTGKIAHNAPLEADIHKLQQLGLTNIKAI